MKQELRQNFLWLLMLMALTQSTFARQDFDKSKDLLLAQYDLRPDEDDIHSAAALGCMLLHDDLKGINYYAVAGSYGKQDSKFISPVVPDFFNLLFGEQNLNWTNAHNDRSGSMTRVKTKIKEITDAGGKVFIAEGGQSDFTHDVLKSLISDGMPASTIKSKVIVVQHSWRNEADDMATKSKLDWVKANTDYQHIDDGNRDDNDTPGYATYGTSYLKNAIASDNTNSKTKEIWTRVSSICKNYTSSYENPKIAAGGLDYSDHAEVWWILDQGDLTFTISKFWERYVVESGTGGGGGTVEPGEQAPYFGYNVTLPGEIQAEAYDLGGKNIAYSDNSNGNSGGAFRSEDVDIAERDGGYVVGWTKDGEWLEYTVDVLPGKYKIEARIGTPESGKKLKLTLDDIEVGVFDVPSTDSWHVFSNITLPDSVTLEGGIGKVLRVTWMGGEVNLNWLRFSGGPKPTQNKIISFKGAQSVEAGKAGAINISYEAIEDLDIQVDAFEKATNKTIATKSFTKKAGRGAINAALEIPFTATPGAYQWKISMFYVAGANAGKLIEETTQDFTVDEPFVLPPSRNGLKIAENYIVIDADVTESPLGKWVVRKKGEANYVKGSDVLGPINDNYIEFTGNTPNGGQPNSPLRYTFTAPKTTSYRLVARMMQILKGEANDKCNDVYVRLEGNFTSGGSFDTDALKRDLKFYGRGLDKWGNIYNGELENEWKQPMIYNLVAGEEYTMVISGRAQRTCIDYFLFYETSINYGGVGEPKNGRNTDIAVVNDEKYLPGAMINGECNEIKAVDFDKYTGISGFVDAEKDSRGGKDVLSVPEALKTSAAILNYNGESGKVVFKLNAMLETDGESTYKLFVNNKLIGEKTNPRIHGTSTANYTIKSHRINYAAVDLNKDDEIRVEFNNATNGLIKEADSPVGTATARGRWYSLQICSVTQSSETGFRNNLTENVKLNIYPNPVKHTVNIESVSSKINEITLMDLQGRLIIQKRSNGLSDQISLKNMNPGLYVLRVTFENNKVQYKTILKQ